MGVFSISTASAASLWLFITSVSSQYGSSQPQAKSGFDYVNPLIGTVNGGHVFPGATLPFGK
ncbi:Glycoside hydrolase family 92 protein [Pyrenophora tritici-repentis]|nr:Glycoside hydrolase family 92 protein [Pyrenophora tritici-repentis]